MKINLEDGNYITDEGWSEGNKKCKLNYIWIGADEGPCVGYVSDKNLEKLYKAIGKILRSKKNENSK